MEERGDRYIHKRFCPYTNEMTFFFFFQKLRVLMQLLNEMLMIDVHMIIIRDFFLKKKIYEYFLNRKLTVRIFSNFLFYKI